MRRVSGPATAFLLAALVAAGTAACGGAGPGGGSGRGSGSGSGTGEIGVDLPSADSDFWNSFARYVPRFATELGITLMTPTYSQNDVARLVANARAMQSQGAEAIVIAPQDAGAVAGALDALAARKVPVVSVGTRPDRGKVFMVVRADNRAYGQKACEFLGGKLGGKGKVIALPGSLSSVDGRDRSAAFAECMRSGYPGITVFQERPQRDGTKAAAALRARLARHPDVKGVYLQAGAAFLGPVLQVLRSTNLLVPPEDPKHVFVASNDGTPEEFEAIRRGELDATVSQPADLYARYALFYAKAAAEGRTFRPGPTDHGSNIVDVGGGTLEDQLPAPLVTRENVDDGSLWGNQVGKR
jgi:simple sugar transport system substrate-binding protein/ribose transport system substrate-binding protein